MRCEVRTITREEHLDFVRARPSVSHLQVPAWGDVKEDWRPHGLGWFGPDGRLVGAGLALLRPVPGIGRSLAYLPEGPVVDWGDPGLAEGWLRPMTAHLKGLGAFTVRMGPPVVARRWSAERVKEAIQDPAAHRLADAEPSAREEGAEAVAERLRQAGWRRSGGGGDGGFALGQPRYVFQLPLRGRSPEQILGGFNQQWRRNVKKAEKAGVKVVEGDGEDLGTFHELYLETAGRDGFTPRPLGYFRRMWEALRAEDPGRMRLYLASHDGETLAAATVLTVGEHVWYSYGASTSRRREVQPSNALQWRMICDALERGAAVYDLRGITDTLEDGDPLLGLLRFKVGTGGEAVEYLGEWELPLNKALHKAFEFYLAARR
ncbi:peptidoglycan bridge formation glycyltransferase FemA/FemB family protein [Streptomyces sp. MJP52]|uniref:lipid II:glycine glycyltransferase FemX n=1 Tax=Streptomyces sp. MJP52 TaxID=2940555 RepID=UPI002475D391|nr:peptidoglycan bridge formation glycyltransferase FemA/FemB family protein [Streptomyces sp. MJP52]MDH6223407.1 lipid II:glycine glycyltransferase (peptidoglycan interpeptide bridge formation enzyme) [Streptomyces sp. MJP52]